MMGAGTEDKLPDMTANEPTIQEPIAAPVRRRQESLRLPLLVRGQVGFDKNLECVSGNLWVFITERADALLQLGEQVEIITLPVTLVADQCSTSPAMIKKKLRGVHQRSRRRAAARRHASISRHRPRHRTWCRSRARRREKIGPGPPNCRRRCRSHTMSSSRAGRRRSSRPHGLPKDAPCGQGQARAYHAAVANGRARPTGPQIAWRQCGRHDVRQYERHQGPDRWLGLLLQRAVERHLQDGSIRAVALASSGVKQTGFARQDLAERERPDRVSSRHAKRQDRGTQAAEQASGSSSRAAIRSRSSTFPNGALLVEFITHDGEALYHSGKAVP